MNDLKALAERLKTQAPHCSVTWEEDGLRVQSACGEVRAAGDRVLFMGEVYRNLRMADSSSLCTAVALFAQCLEEGGPVEPRTREERCACNPTYRATAAALKKLDRRVLTVLGMGVWSARQGLSAGYWAAAGLLLTALGALALLDRRNRALFFLSGGTLLRFDLWGRRQERTVQQIVSVRSCPGRSLALLGEDGRVFFTALSGMCQFQRVRNWAEARQIPIQLVAPPVAGRSVQCWRNAFRSRMHLHLNAARVSLALALAALWTGCLLPPALFALGGLQLGDAVLWMGAAPLPLMVCLVVFAPVTALGGLQEATPAWKAMHALLPYPLLALPAVLLSAMAPAAMDRFLFAEDSRAFPWLWAAFTLVPAALVCLRTPRPRRAAQTVILTALLMLTGYSTACAANLVLQNPAHTAAPVQTQGAAPLTVQRKDGVRFLVTDKRGSALASFDCCVI